MPTNKGFFSSSDFTKRSTVPRIARCGLCKINKNCKSPKMPATGKGRKKILAIAEAPGKEEDRKNIQLIGDAGQLFRKYLRKEALNLDRDLWKTNALICRPPDNRKPTDSEVEACRPNLIKTINQYKPDTILLLGGVAVNSLLSYLWQEKTDSIGRWAGFCIPSQKLNSWIIPTYHPSYLLRTHNKVAERMFRKHLRLAIHKKSKPWKNPPNDKDHVEVIVRPSRAAKIIKQMIGLGGIVSFDYEANCLKPEGDGPEIISCSVCWKGKKTIAYPWHGEAIEATDELLKSPMPKIASNLKFEDRWTRVHLGHPVRGWWWDTMMAAHVLDNRPAITSLKFQSFVLLGAEPYDTHIKPYLNTTGLKRFNRIKELDLKELLLYNGLDSLYAYKVAMRQIKEFRRRRVYYKRRAK